MTQDKVTLRDIMELTREMKDSIDELEKKIDSKVSTNAKEISALKITIGVIENKLSNSSKLQMAISVLLSAIATYLGTRGSL